MENNKKEDNYTIQIDDIPFKKLENCIIKAGNDLYSRDKYLIYEEGRSMHVNERSIVFRFGLYLNKYLSNRKYLSGYSLDCEYNKSLEDIKCISCNSNGSYPDMIIHKRGTHEQNLLVIECKGYWATKSDIDKDIKKLKLLKNNYYYKFALLLIFGKERLELKTIGSK